MKTLLGCVALALASGGCWAQTATELIGRWQLVGVRSPDGKKQEVEDLFRTRQVFQVFHAPDQFEGMVGNLKVKGVWALSADGKTLTVKIPEGQVNFRVDEFTPTHRVIYWSEIGTLTYEKR